MEAHLLHCCCYCHMFDHHCISLFHLFCNFSPISCQHQSSCVIKVGNFHGVLLMTWLHLLHRPYAYRCEAVQHLTKKKTTTKRCTVCSQGCYYFAKVVNKITGIDNNKENDELLEICNNYFEAYLPHNEYD